MRKSAVWIWNRPLSARRGNQKLHIALRAGDRAFNNTFDIPTAAFQPIAHFIAYARVQGGVADHAFLAHFLSPDFKLRLDQRNQLTFRCRQLQRPFKHLGKSDKTRIAHHPIAWTVDHVWCQDARAGLLQYGHALILAQLPCELVSAAIDCKDMACPALQQHVSEAAG